MCSARKKIGLIGLGLLGTAINQRLHQSGFAVVGFDVDPEARERLLSQGGKSASDARSVVAEADTIVFSLPNSDIVHQVLEDTAACLTPQHTIVDTTTGDPDHMVRIAAELASCGVHYVESTVAGSSVQLAGGDAVLLLGGDPESVVGVENVLNAMSEKQIPVGGVGSGARYKLVHNLILGLHRAVLAEGLSFAEALGCDPVLTQKVLRETPAASRVMESKSVKMIQREYSPQAKLSQHLKDVRIILSLAERCGARTPLSHVHRDLLQQAETMGYGDLDNSSIREVFRQAFGNEQP